MTGNLDLENRPDAELVACVVGRADIGQREAAFEVIYARHARAVLALCGGLIWDDFDTARTVAQDALVTAYRDLSSGRPPAQPEKLRAWLLGIARNRCHEEFRRRGRTGLMPDDELPDDDWETASRRRQAEVDRILSAVAATFTGTQQRIYELSTRQGLRGQALAAALQTTEREANDSTYENITRLEEGFGAYILALEGRPFCPVLAGILDASGWDGQAFARVLRLRILKHLDTCPTCGNCETCRDAKKRLVRPYAPALLPIVSISWLHDRVMEMIRAKPAAQVSDSPPRPPALTTAEFRSSEATAPAKERRRPPPPPPHLPPPPARPRQGRRRALRRSAAFGAAAIVPFVLALFITRMAAGSGSPRPALATMPTIAYATGTALVTRQGTAPPQPLAAAPAGSAISQLFWSANGRWLGWFSGPPQGAISQVHITDVTTKTTQTWSCNGCTSAVFQGDRLLAGPTPAGVMAFSPGSGRPALVTIPLADLNLDIPVLLGSTSPAGSVLYVAADGVNLRPQLLEYTSNGQGGRLGQLPQNAVPGGDRNPGGFGMTGTSPDGRLAAYGGNVIGSDTGTGGLSDSVTVLDLHTFGHYTVNLPANGRHNLRICAVWIDSSDTVYAAAWPQPDLTPVNGAVPTVAVTPRVYRLQGQQWIDTGVTEASGSGGQNGWTAVLAGSGSMTDRSGGWRGNLVATAGQTRVSLAADVTAFAWAPSSAPASPPPAPVSPPPTPVSSSGSPGQVQR